jgi:glycosyltransferase involved in cell wall biosynthesis
MRVAITVDPMIPVPPREYGGIERVADIAVRGLIERGHEVTLFAHPESNTAATLVPYGSPPHQSASDRRRDLAQLGAALWRRRNAVDVVFSWGRMAALAPILPLRRLPKIQRYCRSIVPWRSVKGATALAGDSLWFAGASASVYEERPAQGPLGGRWFTLYDAIDLTPYTAVQAVPDDAPLVALGRIERVKGIHTAIAIAKAARRRLIIAGPRQETGPEADYFNREVAPALDGHDVEWIGPVDDAAKNRLLGAAAALLFPIDWKEAFGLVMAESFACGTPVIGFRRGSVPEVIRHGVNGFICGDVEGAVAALDRVPMLDRCAIRQDCERRFSAPVFVDALEGLLLDACAGRRA